MNVRKKERGLDKHKNKLSWIYRKKKSVQRLKNAENKRENNTQVQNKNARIVVRNLSFKATENDVRKFYEPFGQIEEINLLKNADGKFIGCGFVQFKRIEEASKAIFNTNKKEFLGRTICSDWAISKSKFCQKLEQISEANKNSDEVKEESKSECKEEEEEQKQETLQANKDDNKHPKKKDKTNKEFKKKKRKALKLQKRKKRARVIIRNLSFKTTEEDLRNHFSVYGPIEEIKVLTREDGKRIGCAFVQFELVQSAAKAIHYANLQPLLDRQIVVDWALPKNQFKNMIKQEKDQDAVEIKEEKEDNMDDTADTSGTSLKVEVDDLNDSDDSDDSSDSEKEDIEEVTIKSEDELNIDSEEEADIKSEAESDITEIKSENGSLAEEKERKRPRVLSNDVSEGKTVFLKNVPFSVKNEDLKQFIESYGPVHYALVCIDPLTEHSKGTAFVKFKNIEDAEKCLSAGTELRMGDQILETHRALDRKEVENKKNLKHDRIKDSRNLYLVKEGVVLAGSQAAVGVSASDMAKRLQLEQWKSQMLRNLNMFVSRIRLVVHNLPPTFDDSKLRQLFKKHSGPKAIIKEARVMRDFKNIDATGQGKSKEYGFVSFTNHEDALHALRSVNNNPNVFTPHKRPIVAFSIENRIMVNAKQKRLQKSKEHNPLWPRNVEKRKHEDADKTTPTKRQKQTNESSQTPYSGIQSKPGVSKMRSKFNLKTQALLHSKTLKKEKKKTKSSRNLQMKKNEEMMKRKENKPKQGKGKFNTEDTHFAKLVNNYKDKLLAAGETRSKWYEAS